MTTYYLNEPVITAMVARLKAGVDAAVDALNAHYADDLTLDHIPQAQILDYVPTAAELVSFPTVAIADGTSDFEDDVGWSATGVHILGLVVYVQHADQRTLVRSLRRYTQAVTNVALAGRQMGDVWSLQMLGVQPGPTLGRNELPREWMSYRVITIEAKHEEDST